MRNARDEAVAQLAEEVAAALLLFARRIRATPPHSPAGDTTEPVAPVRPVHTAGLGASQKRVLEAVRAAGEGGTTSHAVAKATGLKDTNTPRMLRALEERGLVTRWGEKPTVWFAAADETMDG